MFSSIVLERIHVLSRSGAEPLGEPKFEEGSCMSHGGTGLSDASSTCSMSTGGKQQHWVVDTWTRQNPKKLVKQENHRARSNRKWLEQKMATDCRPCSRRRSVRVCVVDLKSFRACIGPACLSSSLDTSKMVFSYQFRWCQVSLWEISIVVRYSRYRQESLVHP